LNGNNKAKARTKIEVEIDRKRTLGTVDLADGTGLGGDSRHEGGEGEEELHLLCWGWGGFTNVPREEEVEISVPMRFGDELGGDPFQRTNACASAQQVV